MTAYKYPVPNSVFLSKGDKNTFFCDLSSVSLGLHFTSQDLHKSYVYIFDFLQSLDKIFIFIYILIAYICHFTLIT